MNNKNYLPSSKFIALGFAVLLCIQIFGGIIALYSMRESQQKSSYYSSSLEMIYQIQIAFQKQSTTWKDVWYEFKLNNRDLGRDYYHKFSYDLTKVQDMLFNIKLNNKDDKYLVALITDFEKSHEYVSKQHMSTLLSDQKFDYNESRIRFLQISKMNNEALVLLDSIVSYINKQSQVAIETTNQYFYNLFLGVFVGLTVTALFLTSVILLRNRKEKSVVGKIIRKMNSYLPPQLIKSILGEQGDSFPVTKRQFCTVCFTDLQGFTLMTESVEPEVGARILNEYFFEMTALVHRWGGMVDKFVGDGIMILFGAPNSTDRFDEAFRCVQMALEMQQKMKTLTKKWRGEGVDFELGLRIGINSGIVTLGSFGPENRRTYTAIGSAVNIASRLEGLSAVGKLLFGYATMQLISDRFNCINEGQKIVKGIKQPVTTYGVESHQTVGMNSYVPVPDQLCTPFSQTR